MTVTLDQCQSCNADVLVGDRDVLGQVFAAITVDPTPLLPLEHAACVIAGRPVYRYETAAGGALGIAHHATADRKMGDPDVYLPKHRCGFRFDGTLDVAPQVAEYADEPSW